MKELKRNTLLMLNNKILIFILFILLFLPVVHNTIMLILDISNMQYSESWVLLETSELKSNFINDYYETMFISDSSSINAYVYIAIFIPISLLEHKKGSINYNFKVGMKYYLFKAITIFLYVLLIGMIYNYLFDIIGYLSTYLTEYLYDIETSFNFFKNNLGNMSSIIYCSLYCIIIYFLIEDEEYSFIYFIIILMLSTVLDLNFVMISFILYFAVTKVIAFLRRKYA